MFCVKVYRVANSSLLHCLWDYTLGEASKQLLVGIISGINNKGDHVGEQHFLVQEKRRVCHAKNNISHDSRLKPCARGTVKRKRPKMSTVHNRGSITSGSGLTRHCTGFDKQPRTEADGECWQYNPACIVPIYMTPSSHGSGPMVMINTARIAATIHYRYNYCWCPTWIRGDGFVLFIIHI